MGAGASRRSVQQRAISHAGWVPVSVTGRYHLLPKVFEDDYILDGTVLGKGYNGEVHLAWSRCEPGQKFAVKGFKLRGIPRAVRAELESEAEIFLAMDHPNVARLVDVYESKDRLDLVMECLSGGELYQRVVERKRFSEKDAAHAVWQMLLAINYIHSHGVVHRDIKLENFLLESKDGDHLKLIDFGFSKIWEPNTTMALSCGTLAYVAPEVLQMSYTSKCDLWSLGVIVFILLLGYMPFAGSKSSQLQCIKTGDFRLKPRAWERLSSPAQDFLQHLLCVLPAIRFSAEQALAHPWIASRESHPELVDGDMIAALCNFSKASSFRRACMNVMAWSLTTAEQARLRDAFLEMDSDRTGVIHIAEFRRVLEEHGVRLTDQASAEAFNAIDITHDDGIHYSEFLAAVMSTRLALHDELLKDTFRRFDRTGSGFVTADNILEVLGDSFKRQEVEAMLPEDGKVSLEEFVAYLRGNAQTLHERHAHAANMVIDARLMAEQWALEPSPARRGWCGTEWQRSRGGTFDVTSSTIIAESPKDHRDSCHCSVL